MEETHLILADSHSEEGLLLAAVIKQYNLPVKLTQVESISSLLKLLGEQALPDFIFLDSVIRGANSLQCLQQIRGDYRFHNLPVIIYSNSNKADDIEDAYVNGAGFYFKKPDYINDLVTVLQWLVNGAQKKHQTPEREDFLINTAALKRSMLPPPPVARILLVDDDENDNEFHSIIIHQTNPAIEIETITDSRVAISRWQKWCASSRVLPRFLPQLVFLDINMPALNAFQLLDKVRNTPDPNDIKSNMKLFILSTSEKEKYQELLTEYSDLVTDFYTKPLSPEDLGEIMANHY